MEYSPVRTPHTDYRQCRICSTFKFGRPGCLFTVADTRYTNTAALLPRIVNPWQGLVAKISTSDDLLAHAKPYRRYETAQFAKQRIYVGIAQR